MILRAAAPAKINLYLKVTGKRPDGYHTLETVFLPLSAPADTVTLEFPDEPGLRFFCDAPGVPADDSNLAVRAARRYAETTGIAPKWTITLEKRIYAAAGLGGGSSDAAAVLKLLNRHYRALPEAALAALALTLGADVPFFLLGRPALARGIGEELSELAAPESLPLLLIHPRFPVSARWAYGALAPEAIGEDPSGRCRRLTAALAAGDAAGVAAELHNDLGTALERKFPLYGMLFDFLKQTGAAGSLISGSGSSVFGLYVNAETRDRALREFPFTGCDVMAADGLTAAAGK